MAILILSIFNIDCSDTKINKDQQELFLIAKGDQLGFIDRTGKIIVNPQFTYAMNYSEGLIAVELINGKYGFIDKTGKFVINPQFENAGTFSEGLARVRINQKYGYIDKVGNIVIQPQFAPTGQSNGGVFSEGLAAVALGESTDDKEGYIDKTGKIVIEPKYKYATPFSEGLAAVQSYDTGKFGFIDKNGKFVINPQFDFAGYFGGSKGFSEGLAAVGFQKQVGFIDKTGNFIIKPEFNAANDFSEGLAAVQYKKDNRRLYGYINKSGQIVINFQFDLASSFSEGLAAVWIGEKAGYIGTDGKYVINPQYKSGGQFKEGIARVVINDKEVYIDKTGKYIWDPEGISSTSAKASNNENNPQTETKPTEDIVKNAVLNLVKNRPLWDPLSIKPGLTGSIRNVQIDLVSISRYGNYNETNKYWPVQVNISGSLESPAITRVIRCTFNGNIDLRLLKNDYGDWKAEYNQETGIPRLSCEQ